MTDTAHSKPAHNRFVRLSHILFLLGFFILVLGDHLASPPTSALAAPADDKASCAPCGAPCSLTEKK
ncbi:MAG: hypothetical protein ACON4F_01105 [Candidatus Puniceispirillaceae bacterium]